MKINVGELECCMDIIVSWWMGWTWRTFKNSSHRSGWTNVIFELATLDELDDVNNLKQSIWDWIISQDFPWIFFWCSPNHIYCDLVGPFLQYVFQQCYLLCWCYRLCLESFLGAEVSPHLHPCITVGIYQIHAFGRFTSPTSPHWRYFNIKGGSCFYFAARCINIYTTWWCMENSLWNWLSIRGNKQVIVPIFELKMENYTRSALV